jgi:hypothetical protein
MGHTNLIYIFMKRQILILSNITQPQSKSNTTKIHPGYKNNEICIKSQSNDTNRRLMNSACQLPDKRHRDDSGVTTDCGRATSTVPDLTCNRQGALSTEKYHNVHMSTGPVVRGSNPANKTLRCHPIVRHKCH